VYGGSTKNASVPSAERWRISSRPSCWRKVILSRCSAIFSIRRFNVSGYQRDLTPLPFSPCLRRLALSAIMPARLTRFLTIVANARDRRELHRRDKTALAAFLDI